jgi:hypothetical protein
MTINGRLIRLERQQPSQGRTFLQSVADFAELETWLAERNFADALAALEAGDVGPAGLEDLLQKCAGYDRRHRAFARIERALAAGELPAEADLKAV